MARLTRNKIKQVAHAVLKDEAVMLRKDQSLEPWGLNGWRVAITPGAQHVLTLRLFVDVPTDDIFRDWRAVDRAFTAQEVLAGPEYMLTSLKWQAEGAPSSFVEEPRLAR